MTTDGRQVTADGRQVPTVPLNLRRTAPASLEPGEPHDTRFTSPRLPYALTGN